MEITNFQEKQNNENKKNDRKNFKIILFASFLIFFIVGFISGIKYYPLIKEEINKILSIRIRFSPPKLFIEKKENITSTPSSLKEESNYQSTAGLEENIIKVVKEASPSVVSIIITKDLPVFEQYYINPFKDFFGPEDFNFPDFQIPQYKQKGTEKREVGGGTGFIISEDGLVLTNKHVVSDKKAQYTIITNDGKKYDAKVLALDPIQDLAIIKIQKPVTDLTSFKPIQMGDSSNLQIGQIVIAIGNALGEFRNTVSMGVISGLGRTITASGAGMVEILEDVIQTDAAINSGNSGGPLLNLKGQVIGVNVAMAQDAQNIGFAIPINKAKRDVEQIKTIGKIIYPWLGVRYILINQEVKEKYHLTIDYGALIVKNEENNEPGVIPGSPAEKAGLKEGDIILELNGEKITSQNSLSKIITKYSPGDNVTLKVLRDKKTFEISVVLVERPESL
ncbi:MAG: S1C family serine protease [Minisyncoccia bacterium]